MASRNGRLAAPGGQCGVEAWKLSIAWKNNGFPHAKLAWHVRCAALNRRRIIVDCDCPIVTEMQEDILGG